MRNFTNGGSLIAALAMIIFMAGCTTADFNASRDGWNAPEYVYQPPRIKRKYETALATMESGDDLAAAAEFRQFIITHPQYPGAYVNLAIIYARQERPDEALAVLDESLEIAPEYVYALNQQGIIKRHEGDFEGAMDAWLRATRSDPTYANAWYNLGVLHDLYLQDLPAALEAYRRYQEVLVSTDKPTGENVVVEADVEVARWIADIERRIGTPSQAASTVEIR